MGERRGAYRFLVEEPEGKKHWENLGVDEKVKLKRIFRNRSGARGLD
jgi:cupin superfamily acireductone dioxygenase involved in methionine salvage